MKYGVMVMKVELISYSQSLDGKDLLQQIAFAARVSNVANQHNKETAEKLVRYLIKNQHWSPLEMVSVCLEIETTRDIARQILRHRSFSFQEFSQRYAYVDMEHEYKEARLQDHTNRQNSIETDNTRLSDWWLTQQKMVASIAERVYNESLDKGIAKEQARAVLPEGLTKSKMYMNGTLRSWVHYIQLRSDKATQKEHREIALACATAIEPIFPMIKEFISE